MKFAEKIQRSWDLLRSALLVIRNNPKLALFPLITTLLTMVIVVVMVGLPVGALALMPTGHSMFESAHWNVVGQHLQQWSNEMKSEPGHLGLRLAVPSGVALIYIVSMFLATFCNVAMYEQIMQGLNGQPVSIRAGFRFAWSKRMPILCWSLFAATVGLILKMLAERFGWLGRLALRFVGLAWSLAALFVIPVIIRSEDRNPITLVRKSVGTLRQTWGESLIGYIGVQTGAALIVLGFFFACLILAATGWLFSSVVPPIAAGVIFLIGFLFMIFMVNLAEHVFRCSLYVYASEGVVPEPFTSAQLDGAWKIKAKG